MGLKEIRTCLGHIFTWSWWETAYQRSQCNGVWAQELQALHEFPQCRGDSRSLLEDGVVVTGGYRGRCKELSCSGALSPITPTRATQLLLYSPHIIGFRKDFI